MDGGMLSQDEINALLSGMDLSEEGDSGSAGGTEEAASASDSPAVHDPLDDVNAEDVLTEVEKDAIGEVANISMGSSATTLYSLVNRKVNITTPVVEIASWNTLLSEYEKPCVFIQIKYTMGLDGTNILVLKEQDVKIITDLMMGGDGTNTDGELGELHLSAISEAMNQMMGSAATSLSTMLKKTIDISPPDSTLLDLTQYKSGEEISPFLGGVFVKVSFRMQIDELVDSNIMQLYPVEFARDIVKTFLDNQMGGAAAAAPEPEPAPAAPAPDPAAGQMQMNNMGQMDMSGMQMGMNPMGMQMGMMPQMGMVPQQAPNVNVQPAQFQSFSGDGRGVQGQENIGLIMDVPLEVTVELGRSTKSISEILNFAPGTIIELDRIAGEPIDVLVNGKFVAKGEVVVIDECFSIRVTEIIK